MLNKSQKQFAEAMYSALGTDVVSRNDINTFQKENGCLLYTSPSPRDLSTSRMPSSA